MLFIQNFATAKPLLGFALDALIFSVIIVGPQIGL